MILESKYSFRLLSKAKIDELKLALIDSKTEKEEVESDSRKRSLLKLMGVVGVGALATSLMPKNTEALVFGSTPTSNIIGVKNSANLRINPAQEDGGNLASIKTNTDNLSGIKTSTDNLSGIKTDTANLASIKTAVESTNTADGFIKTNTDTLVTNSNKLTFVGDSLKTVSAGSEVMGVKDTLNNQINPAQDDSIVLLRRMVKLMESQATVDAGNRQRITLDALGAIGTTVPVSGTVTVGTISAVTNMTSLAGQNQQMYQDVARNAYANGIRNNLIFS
jgi:hypothetical protein